MESQRQIRFGELIRSLISDCLLKEEFYDEKINSASITISFVRMSKDLRIAKAAVADIVSLTDAASIEIDFNAGQNFAVQLTDNRTLENATN